MKNKQGKVWLVGAGPSDAGLLTLKGKEVMEQADVIVYDRLVGQSILSLIPSTVQVIDAGKRSGNHTLPQEEINQLLLREAQKGHQVVRLKGGDPFLFGRGGEELELLVEHGIPYEIVPGVTSAISVPAYHGIPVTHRDFSSSVHIIAGHRRKNAALDIPFKALTDVGGTLVFLMGVSALSAILNGLLDAGMEPSVPAAILQQGTTSSQKSMLATVATLEKEANKEEIKTPAILIVGNVCRLADKFSWYEHLPLFGEKIVITRPKDRSSSLADKLRAFGAEVLLLPSISTPPLPLSKEAEKAFSRLSDFQYTVFTSPYGVDRFYEILQEKQIDIRTLHQSKIAAIGSATAAKLEARGILPDLIPETYDAKNLGQLIARHCKDSDHILIPRARIGSSEIISEIKKQKKAVIYDIPIYDTIYERPNPPLPLKKELENGSITAIMFTSASTVRGFGEMTQGADYTRTKAICIGSRTGDEARRLGMDIYTAEEATIDSMIECLCQHCSHRENVNEAERKK